MTVRRAAPAQYVWSHDRRSPVVIDAPKRQSQTPNDQNCVGSARHRLQRGEKRGVVTPIWQNSLTAIPLGRAHDPCTIAGRQFVLTRTYHWLMTRKIQENPKGLTIVGGSTFLADDAGRCSNAHTTVTSWIDQAGRAGSSNVPSARGSNVLTPTTASTFRGPNMCG